MTVYKSGPQPFKNTCYHCCHKAIINIGYRHGLENTKQHCKKYHRKKRPDNKPPGKDFPAPCQEQSICYNYHPHRGYSPDIAGKNCKTRNSYVREPVWYYEHNYSCSYEKCIETYTQEYIPLFFDNYVHIF